ncbi:hypothetical protein CXF80_19030 [Shewanella sp. Actino-trap-3]|jgi:hypothetical protein|uniref:hypothetical protein n=1 Tax=Shewanella sp. Actino-trap-3 TaxID=2058331 RepID=UPI000C323F57|nr:hypothetical protein [Shewanella sp. Actino-trap-3]PKG80222.1 hypothetical protein CXF80_19030 [Shewanella sp. Actino-trap-3]
MKVCSSTKTIRYERPSEEGVVKIEFAIPKDGGNSSAGEKYDFIEKSVRLSWWSGDGRFDPISSGELPEWALMDVVESCAKKDFLTTEQAATLICELSESIKRQNA